MNAKLHFYHLTRSDLEGFLPELLMKTLANNMRAVVRLGSSERVEALARHLWTWRADSFLPHGTEQDGNPKYQPIWLTTADERPNGADVLILADGMNTDIAQQFQRICDIFDGRDQNAQQAALARLNDAKQQGYEVTYWQQTASGWTKREPAEL